MKFKNVLCCTVAILPMFCAVESQATNWASKTQEKAYNNTQKLNEKQKLFLNVIKDSLSEETQLALCYYDSGISKIAETCKTGASGAGWEFSNKKQIIFQNNECNLIITLKKKLKKLERMEL